MVWLNLPMVLCIPILVNQTPRLAENLCFWILCFARAFLSYSCLFPILALLESSNSNKPLHNYFCYTLCGLSCSYGDVFHPSSAAPTTEPSITAEQYPRRRFQRPRIFFPASDSHTSIITILHIQPNDAEVHKAMPKRLYTRHITLFLHSCVLQIHVSQTPRLIEILCFQMICFARAFLSYSCIFSCPCVYRSSNSKEPLQIYFIFR